MGLTRKTFLNVLGGIEIGDLLIQRPGAVAQLPLVLPTDKLSAHDLMNEIMGERLGHNHFTYSYKHPLVTPQIPMNMHFTLIEYEHAVLIGGDVLGSNFQYELLEDVEDEQFEDMKNWSSFFVMHCLGSVGPFVTYLHVTAYSKYKSLAYQLTHFTI